MKTRAGLLKNAKIAGCNEKHADYIPKSKVGLFLGMFQKIEELCGSARAAEKKCGIYHKGIKSEMQKGILSAYQGKKILEAYKRECLAK